MAHGSPKAELSGSGFFMRFCLLLAGLMILQACTVLPRMMTQDQSLQAIASAESVSIQGVHFYPQQEYFCGPSSLAALFKHAGHDVDPRALAEAITTPELRGTLKADLTASARQHGFVPIQIDGMQSLMAALQNGKPVLVLVNLGLSISPQWHYMVVYGYDSQQAEVLVRSGEMAVPSINVYTFDQLWKRADRWGIVLLRPDAPLPAFVTSKQWLKESLNLETINPSGYEQAMNTGSTHFESTGAFDFALGNLALSRNKAEEAAARYQISIEKNPDFAPAWNNMAESLFIQNRHMDAKLAVERAILLGGKFADEYKKTLEKIEQALTAQ